MIPVFVRCPWCDGTGIGREGVPCDMCIDGEIEYLPADGYDEEIDASDAGDATA